MWLFVGCWAITTGVTKVFPPSLEVDRLTPDIPLVPSRKLET